MISNASGALRPYSQLSDSGMPNGLQVDNESLTGRTYLKLRKGLTTGHFRPGQRLLLKPLANELGVSITPVREALLRLASENGVVADKSRTLMVPIISRARFREIRDIRVELEGRAAEAAATLITAEDIEVLQEMHNKLLQARNAGNAGMALYWNEAFHFRIYRASGLHVLCTLIESLWVQVGPLLSCLPDYTELRGPHPHEAILWALKEGAGPAARHALTSDLLLASQQLEKIVDSLNEGVSPGDSSSPIK